MKARLRDLLSSHPTTRAPYEFARASYHQLRKLTYFLHDVSDALRFMKWVPARRTEYAVLSAELLFQFHKLEKGFSMPNRRQVFGRTPAVATLDLLQRWRHNGFSTRDPVYQGAIECLRTYTRLSARTSEAQALFDRLDAELANHATPCTALETPMKPRVADGNSEVSFFNLMLARRSVRNFAERAVNQQDIMRAVQVALFSPSACNRQPWRVHVYSDGSSIRGMLALQNGNAGFGHTVPCLLVVTSTSSGYFDASERWQPYVDGGLFSMSLLLALQCSGISTCCLNWCVPPQTDEAAHRLGSIPPDEKIIMYIAAGYPVDDVLVPRSARRAPENVVNFH